MGGRKGEYATIECHRQARGKQHLCVNLKHLAEETLFRWPAEVTAGSSSLLPLYDELRGHKDTSAFNTAVDCEAGRRDSETSEEGKIKKAKKDAKEQR